MNGAELARLYVDDHMLRDCVPSGPMTRRS